MKLPLLITHLLVSALLCVCCQRKPSSAEAVNAVLGDVSYVRKFGTEPTPTTDEHLRVTAHFQYVEAVLQRKGTRALTNRQRRNRYHALKLLRNYWMAGQYPANYDFPHERRPCLIDRTGQPCAVAYLIEQTASRELAEQINAKHQYDRIEDIRTPEFLRWVKSSGFAIDELAMIQPTYGPATASAQQALAAKR
ncbi:hypothetical protein [Solirubrum puertoriconensis]|uniref:Uncharacterized protein n=1 Tax=Solirubrum puertoriconensis TaxID=1751427 RepID=A0A9X0HNU5_SOLP1|nr:hypothetical protein [Solirubrum puertoriconensis]KUG09512.1 hypothetical protein ASU33_17510 [Solirubrum puertoriconensis]